MARIDFLDSVYAVGLTPRRSNALRCSGVRIVIMLMEISVFLFSVMALVRFKATVPGYSIND